MEHSTQSGDNAHRQYVVAEIDADTRKRGIGDQARQDVIEIDVTDDSLRVDLQKPSRVPFIDLASTHEPLAEQILSAWEEILRTGAFIGGEPVEAFEEEFARYVGTREAVGVGNGTDALVLGLRGLGVEPGHEVITAPHTFSATAQAIVRVGATPVFVDVDPVTGTIDPDQIEARITNSTKALLPVHLYGQPADVGPINEIARRHGLVVLEDSAQSHGAEYQGRRAGSLTDAAAFSFYPGKNLGACGDAGAITTDDPDLASRLRMLRDHGQSTKHEHELVGFNSRLDALQAAALRIKLPHLDTWTKDRRRWASLYSELLASLPLDLPSEAPNTRHVYHLFVVRHPNRDALQRDLESAGVATGLHYPVPVHLQPAFRDLGYERGSFPDAEEWAFRGFSLPMFPELSEKSVAAVCSALSLALEGSDVLA